jgi:hypothetical protein
LAPPSITKQHWVTQNSRKRHPEHRSKPCKPLTSFGRAN